eukprot:SAG11_NODE_14374_length_614_cov_1.297087_1_plen_25_part_10
MLASPAQCMPQQGQPCENADTPAAA